MAFKKVDEKDKKPNLKRIGTLWESEEYKGVFLQVDPDCDVILYDRASGKYYKVNKLTAKMPNDSAPQNAIFNFFADLDNEKHVVYQGSDEE